MRKLFFVLIALFSFVACSSEPPVDSGEIINKRFEPEHWESGYVTRYRVETVCRQVYQGNNLGYQTRCLPESVPYQEYEPHHEWVSDRWKLQLESCETTNSGKYKCRKGWVTVTHQEYEEAKIGSNYP